MNSRIEPKIRAVLETRRKFSKYALAEATPCHQRTAQRVLTRLHQQGEIHIVAWVSIYHAPIPQYVIGPGKDAPRPRPQTKAETARMYRARHPEVYVRAKALRRKRERAPTTRFVQALPDTFRILGGHHVG